MHENNNELGAHPLHHLAIIMDGNNRWAKERGLSGIAGHEAGVERIRDILKCARSHNIRIVTLFAFSSENWSRPTLEVRGLMSLFATYLKKEGKALKDDDVRLKIIGNQSHLSSRLKNLIRDVEDLTFAGKFTLNLCVDYGGRWDIINTARNLAAEVQIGHLRPDQITEELFDRHIEKSSIAAPDLCIRTAGERRISNFLLWQLAYSELYFSDCYWPDFDESALEIAIRDYEMRTRRFGLRNASQNGENFPKKEIADA